MKNEKKKVNAKQNWKVTWLLENMTCSVLLTAVIRCPPLDTDVKIVAQSHICRRCITFMVPMIGVIDPHLFTEVLWWNLEICCAVG